MKAVKIVFKILWLLIKGILLAFTIAHAYSNMGNILLLLKKRHANNQTRSDYFDSKDFASIIKDIMGSGSIIARRSKVGYKWYFGKK